MALRVHKRSQIVRVAESEMNSAIWDVVKDHDLTYIEALQCIVAAQQNLLRYALREERHPEDPDKRADEA